jgi:hypothetical protein
MKCIKCDTDNNLRDRTANAGKCSKCSHPFVFEPTVKLKSEQSGLNFSKPLTDPFFAKVISDISANHTLFSTPKQLQYLLGKRLIPEESLALNPQLIGGYVGISLFLLFFNPLFFNGLLRIDPFGFTFMLWLVGNLLLILALYGESSNTNISTVDRGHCAVKLQIAGIFILIIGGVYSFFAQSIIVFGLVALEGLGSMWLGLFQKMKINRMEPTSATVTFSVSKKQMRDWLDRWQKVNGAFYLLLPAPLSSISPASENQLPDADVTNYSFDRVIVCQSDEIAQMLIANNFHFENNCAILSLAGYPQNIFDTTMQMLRRNPDLKVFALHDCSPSGMRLAHQLRTDSKWFPDLNIVIIDIGLTPRQIMAAKRSMSIFTNKSMADVSLRLDTSIRQTLTAAELQWLDAGNFVELESFTPQKLLHVVQRGIANQSLSVGDDNLILIGDGGSDNYIFATESFG